MKIVAVALYDLCAAYLALFGAILVRFSGPEVTQTIGTFWPFLPAFGLVAL